MSAEYRQAKYLLDLDHYTQRQLQIIYDYGCSRPPMESELKRLIDRAEDLEDYETIETVEELYGYVPSDDEEFDFMPYVEEEPVSQEEVDAVFTQIRAMCFGPIKPDNPNPKTHYRRQRIRK